MNKKLAWIYNDSEAVITEELKAEVDKDEQLFPKDVGEKHPCDFLELERWYKDDTFVNGIINKLVDFTVGPGFCVKSKDVRVQEICDMWIKDNQFIITLSQFIRDSLIYGNGFMELSGGKDEVPDATRCIDPKTMYVRWDQKGNLLGYSQWRGETSQGMSRINSLTKIIPFQPYEIAHLSYNVVGSTPYGTGVIYPLRWALKNKVALVSNMNMLMKRKANVPYHVKMGLAKDGVNDVVPSDADIQDFGKKLEWLHNKHEWVTNPYIDIKAVDFGSIGDKFVEPLNIMNKELVWGSQVPEVLLGSGNIAEGLAQEQFKAFMFRIRAIQENAEKVLEEQVFKRLISANGLNGEDLEIVWNIPTPEEKKETVTMIKELLGMYMSGGIDDLTRRMLINRLKETLEFTEEEISVAEKEVEEEKKEAEKIRKQMEEEPQPQVPPTKLERPVLKKPEIPREKYVNENFDVSEDVTLAEWVGFNYGDFLENIKQFIKSKDFENREFTTFRYIPGTEHIKWETAIAHYNLNNLLSKKQVSKLRSVLINAFENGESISKISKNIYNEVKPKALLVNVPPLEKDGVIIRSGFERTLTPQMRSNLFARTETIRASNEGALNNYSDNGVNIVEWIAAPGENTCEYCSEQNGKTLNLDNAREQIPAHVNCRCSWAPFIK